MLPLEQPDRIHVAFDDHRLVANAGLLSFRSLWPIIWDWASWWTIMLTWEMCRVGRMREIRC